jgi:glutamate/tyrosine decarboxylase-like PLP-dependent enzyme
MSSTEAVAVYTPKKENFVLPKAGVPDDLLLEQITSYKEQDEARWKDGQVSGGIYHGEEDHMAMQNHALAMFSISNPLHGDIWPSVVKMEAEIISMTANLVNGGDKEVCGAITSGGTESILMSVKTHRAWAEARGITEPEIICCFSSHAAIDKACDMLKVKLIKTPFHPESCEMLVDEVSKHINPNTIMVYASAPNYPQGIIDPIGPLSELVQSQPFGKPIGLHVDCCLGGFFLPFARKLRDNIPVFDFALAGVTAMSCDTHKYGYAAKGTSVVLYRNSELRNHQFFAYPGWTGGMYVTPTTAGSRPGALSAACWCSMMRLGEQGYLDATERILATTEKLTEAIRRTPGLFVLGDPKAMVVAFGSKDFNIYALSDEIGKRGFGMSPCQSPACVHLCVTLRHGPVVAEIIHNLTDIAKQMLANPELGKDTKVAMYGAASSSSASSTGGADAVPGDADPRTKGMLRYMSKVLDMPFDEEYRPKPKKNKAGGEQQTSASRSSRL